MVNYQALIDKQTELNEEIEMLSTLDKKKAKAIVKRLLLALSEIDSVIAKNQKAIDLQKIASASAILDFQKAFKSLVVENAIDYNVRCNFDFNFATGLVNSTIKPATLRGSKDSVYRYNGKAMPEVLHVNLSDDKGTLLDFGLVKPLEMSDEFSSWESLYQTFLACYADGNGNSLQAEVAFYNSDWQARKGTKCRFDSASAKTGKLQRLTQNVVDLVPFVDVIATGKTGNAQESASQAVG